MKHERISKDDYYLNIAEAVSLRSTCLRRQYGVVIVNNDEIVATGYNGSPRGETNCCDCYEDCPRRDEPHNSGNYGSCPSVHGEQNALLSASRKDVLGASVYMFGYECEIGPDGTLEKAPIRNPEPCPICRRMLKNAGVRCLINNETTIYI